MNITTLQSRSETLNERSSMTDDARETNHLETIFSPNNKPVLKLVKRQIGVQRTSEFYLLVYVYIHITVLIAVNNLLALE